MMRLPLARESIDRALALAPDLGEAYARLGDVKTQYEMDWPGAERAFRRAIQLNPSYAPAHQWLGLLLGVSGHSMPRSRSSALPRRSSRPCRSTAPSAAWSEPIRGEPDAAIELLERSLAIAPGLPNAPAFLTMAYLRRGDLERAAEHAAAIGSPAPGKQRLCRGKSMRLPGAARRHWPGSSG